MSPAAIWTSMDILELLPIGISALALILSGYSAYKARKNAQIMHNSLIQNQFFAEYTRRYQDLRVKWPTALIEKVDDTFYELYFDMCSEEYYLRSIRAISDEVWHLWEDGIRTVMHRPWFQEKWKIQGIAYKANEKFCHFMSEMQRQIKTNHQ